MATLEQIAEAIRRADAAGNADDVRALGAAYRALQQQSNAAPSDTPAAKPGSRAYADWALSQDRWERAVLLPMEKNLDTGERRWAVPGFIDAAIGAAALPGDVMSGKTALDPRVSYRDQDPETLDRAAVLAGGVGGELPLAARGMVRPATRGMVNGSGQRIPKLIADELEAANIAPGQVNQRVSAMGPAAVLGDVSPRLQARVGAVATTPGPGQDMIVEAMRARQLAAKTRMQADVEQNFGPEPVPSQVRANIDADRIAANANYPPVFAEKAMSGATPFDAMYDAKPLFDALDQQVPNFLGETRSKIQTVRDMLINPATGELVTDPQIVLAARQELDGMIGALKDQRGSKTTIAALGDMRKMIDDDLALQVPGIKAADAIRAEVYGQTDAFDLGRNVLRGGEEPLNPADLAVKAAELIGKGPLRLSQGTLSKVYELIGTAGNDRVALRNLLKGEGSWNREKLVTVFGKEKTDKLIDLLDNEANMAITENMAIGNSKTEVIRSAKEGIEPKAKGRPGPIANLFNIQPGTAAQQVGDALLGGVFGAQQTARNRAIAEALLSRGGWRPGPMGGATTPGAMPLQNIAVLDALIEQGRAGGVLPIRK
jgi:hypothetical protein